jgi:hypothetical protein
MGEDVVMDRNAFIGRIGIFFLLVGLFSFMIFVATDLTEPDESRKQNATATMVVAAIQAIQTRDAEATLVAPHGLPPPTLIPAEQLAGITPTEAYTVMFSIGIIGLVIGVMLIRATAPPPKPASAGRFAWLRNWLQKRREAAKKREEARKAKQGKK